MNQILNDLKHFEDFWYTFIAPVVCFCSLSTNLINLIVLYKLKEREKFNKYFFIKSIINSIYLFILIFIFIIKCGRYCDIKDSYLAKLYQIYLFYYFTSCLGLIDLLIETVISINRYMTITNNHLFARIRIKTIITIFIFVSAVFYTPYLFVFELKGFTKNFTNNNNTTINFETKYVVRPLKKYLLVLEFIDALNFSIRSALLIILIIFINVFSFCKFSKNVNNLIALRKIRESKF